MIDAPWELDDTLAPLDGAPLTPAQEARINDVIAELRPYWTFS